MPESSSGSFTLRSRGPAHVLMRGALPSSFLSDRTLQDRTGSPGIFRVLSNADTSMTPPGAPDGASLHPHAHECTHAAAETSRALAHERAIGRDAPVRQGARAAALQVGGGRCLRSGPQCGGAAGVLADAALSRLGPPA